MRSMFSLILMFTSLASGADQVERVRADFLNTKDTFVWDRENPKVPALIKAVYAGPGRLSVQRRPLDMDVWTNYEVKAYDFKAIHISTNFRLKSTTCPNVPNSLTCHIDTRVRTLFIGGFAAGSAEPAFRAAINRYGENAEFLAKYFPELTPIPVSLSCDTWAWAAEPTGMISFRDVGSIDDIRNSDLEVNEFTMKTVAQDVRCQTNQNGACAIPQISSVDAASIHFASAIYLEAAGNGGCTVELGATTVRDENARFDDLMRSLGVRIRSRSGKRRAATMQARLTDEMLKDWQDTAIRDAINAPADKYVPTNELKLALHFPWPAFLGVVQNVGYEGSANSGGRYIMAPKFLKER